MFVMLSLSVIFAKPVLIHFIAPFRKNNCKDYCWWWIRTYAPHHTAWQVLFGKNLYQEKHHRFLQPFLRLLFQKSFYP